MLTCTQKIEPDTLLYPTDFLTLDFEHRSRARFKAVTDNGQEISIFMNRGTSLQNGDLLKSECGTIIGIKSLPEEVITARSKNWQTFSRACYHLGNRHVPLQIGSLWLRFKPDHVLENMVRTLGLDAGPENVPFEPEKGAYGGHHHSHS